MKQDVKETALPTRPKSMQELLDYDPLGLLNNVGEKRATMSVSEKVSAEFKEFADFVQNHKRLPSKDSDDFDEELMAIRFEELSKSSPEGRAYCESLLQENSFSAPAQSTENLRRQVSSMQTRLYESLDDAVQDDPLGLLSDLGEGSDEHEYWRGNVRRKQSDSADHDLARAKVCKDFYRYKHFFDEINTLLAQGHLKAINILGDTGMIGVGDIFVISGVMSLVSFIDDKNVFSDPTGGRRQRIKQILINGKENNPLSNSLRTTFYKHERDSKRIVHNDGIGLEYLRKLIVQLKDLEAGRGNSVLSGYIYILSTKSQDPAIVNLLKESPLVKIGYTTTDVNKRIANAENEATYLFAGVNIIKSYACYDFDAKDLEDALHTVLAEHCLNVELTDHTGKKYRPHEWFTVSAETASQIVDHIICRDLDKYYVDPIQGKLMEKQKL